MDASHLTPISRLPRLPVRRLRSGETPAQTAVPTTRPITIVSIIAAIPQTTTRTVPRPGGAAQAGCRRSGQVPGQPRLPPSSPESSTTMDREDDRDQRYGGAGRKRGSGRSSRLERTGMRKRGHPPPVASMHRKHILASAQLGGDLAREARRKAAIAVEHGAKRQVRVPARRRCHGVIPGLRPSGLIAAGRLVLSCSGLRPANARRRRGVHLSRGRHRPT